MRGRSLPEAGTGQLAIVYEMERLAAEIERLKKLNVQPRIQVNRGGGTDGRAATELHGGSGGGHFSGAYRSPIAGACGCTRQPSYSSAFPTSLETRMTA